MVEDGCAAGSDEEHSVALLSFLLLATSWLLDCGRRNQHDREIDYWTSWDFQRAYCTYRRPRDHFGQNRCVARGRMECTSIYKRWGDGWRNQTSILITENDTKSIATFFPEFEIKIKIKIIIIIKIQNPKSKILDYNLEVALEQSEKGYKELQKAEEYQKSNKSLKCIAILVCLNTFLICLFIIKHHPWAFRE